MNKRIFCFLLVAVILAGLASVSAFATNAYSIEYDTMGGNMNIAGQTKRAGVDAEITWLTPKKEGYIFRGWSTSPDGILEYIPGGTYSKDEDVIFYAVWESVSPEKPEPYFEWNTVALGDTIRVYWDKCERASQYEVFVNKKDSDECVFSAIAITKTSEYIYIPEAGEYDVYVISVNPTISANSTRTLSDKLSLSVRDKDFVPEIVMTIDSRKALVFDEEVENDVAPIIRNDRTMLPARFIAEKLGATVSWDEDIRCVTIEKNKTLIEIFVDSDIALVNGEKVKLDSPAFIENDRTYTPVRFICESLGAKVLWNAELYEVTVVCGG